MARADATDPRTAVIEERLEGVTRIIGVTGSKGGIGKSVVASTMALALADQGVRVGLFDLDFTSPSDHVVLGVDRRFPDESFGIDPHLAHGIQMMSVAFFAGDAPLPLRGEQATSALIELLAITRWVDLDVLFLDMPPGLGDASLDVIRLIPRLEFLLVGNGSRVVIESVRRAVRLFVELETPIVGIVENMPRGEPGAVADLAANADLRFLGSLPYDESLEDSFGDVEKLRATALYEGVSAFVGRL